MYEKPKNEQDNFMFYGQNPNFNKSPPTNSQPNFKQNPQSFQSNYPNNSNTPNINYFNNYPQNPNQNNILVPPSNQIDYQGPEFPSNKMNFPVQNNQYNNMNNNNPCKYLFNKLSMKMISLWTLTLTLRRKRLGTIRRTMIIITKSSITNFRIKTILK